MVSAPGLRPRPCRLDMATSSSDLKTTAVGENRNQSQINKDLKDKMKKEVNNVKGAKNNVVSRLAKAAKEAAVAKKKKTITSTKKARRSDIANNVDPTSEESTFSDVSLSFEIGEHSHEDQKCLASITKLNSVIDEELLRPNDGYRPARETDSIRVLLEHNNNQKYNNGRPTTAKSIISSSSKFYSSSKLTKKRKYETDQYTRTDVAIMFARPLSDGQLTIEYAVRLVSLAKAIKFLRYNPKLICFCGPVSPSPSTGAGNMEKHGLVTTIGVDFFKRLCTSNEISLEGIDLCHIPDVSSTIITKADHHQFGNDSDDRSYRDELSNHYDSSWSPSSLNPVVKKLLGNQYLEQWLEESKAYESDMDEYGMTRQEPRKKIHIHWKLFSTEYHLCNLNDIHIRSPRQSPLARLVQDLEHASSSAHYRRGIIQTTWSFHYSIYPYVVSSNKEKLKEAFLGKCYLMAQSLVPLLVNLKGVAENSEFFQRDNYRKLVATRRSLATLLEQMNEAYRHNREQQTASMVIPPTLKAQLKKKTSEYSTTIISIEIHLECALLSLGRCCDLVRPAGTFSEQSVSRQEWKDALHHLQDFMNRIECSCDPDRPVSLEHCCKKLTENRPVMEFLS